MRVQTDQFLDGKLFDGFGFDGWLDLEHQGDAFSFFRDDLLLGICGVVLSAESRGNAWMLISEGITPRDLLFLTREGVKVLDRYQLDPSYKRLETTVRNDFHNGHRWAKRLGFSMECVMPCYDAAGNAHALYSRIADVA